MTEWFRSTETTFPDKQDEVLTNLILKMQIEHRLQRSYVYIYNL